MTHPLAAVVTAATLVSYVFIYTRRSAQDDAEHADRRGARRFAARDRLDRDDRHARSAGALVLFLIVFLWQVPHFLAIAWIYREDYARAGLKMLPAARSRTARRPPGRCCSIAWP